MSDPQQQQQQQQMPQVGYASLLPPNFTNPMNGPTLQLLQQFWVNQMATIERGEVDMKQHQLPLARIKKVMKTDEDVRHKMMISAEAPLLFAKACEIFILELTLRSWIHTEENKRRTLQRSDVAQAISKADIFDFLIDIVPREEVKGLKRGEELRHIMMPEYAASAAAAYYQMPYAAGMNANDPNALYQQQLQQMQYMRQQMMPSQDPNDGKAVEGEDGERQE